MSDARTFRLLAIVYDFLGGLTRAELDALLDGSVKLSVQRSQSIADLQTADSQGELSLRSKGAPASKQKEQPESSDFTQLISDLSKATDRASALQLLESQTLTKAGLEKFARSLSVPANKTDNTERLRDKIIEHVVGSQLNSAAIRGD